jgi:hypothetical protein
MTTDKFCFYLQNRLIQTSPTGGQWCSDTSPFSIPWFESSRCLWRREREHGEKKSFFHFIKFDDGCFVLKAYLSKVVMPALHFETSNASIKNDAAEAEFFIIFQSRISTKFCNRKKIHIFTKTFIRTKKKVFLFHIFFSFW